MVALEPMEAPALTIVLGRAPLEMNWLLRGKPSFAHSRIGADDDVIFDRDARRKLDTGPDGHPIPDHDITLDQGVITNTTVAADPCARPYVRKCEYPRTFPNCIRFDYRCGMSKHG